MRWQSVNDMHKIPRLLLQLCKFIYICRDCWFSYVAAHSLKPWGLSGSRGFMCLLVKHTLQPFTLVNSVCGLVSLGMPISPRNGLFWNTSIFLSVLTVSRQCSEVVYWGGELSLLVHIFIYLFIYFNNLLVCYIILNSEKALFSPSGPTAQKHTSGNHLIIWKKKSKPSRCIHTHL